MPDLKNKHLTMENRQEIMECLDKGMTFKAIGRRISKDPTTVSKEVKKHLTQSDAPPKVTKLDGTVIKEQPCPKILRAPFVCNPCEKRRRPCSYIKQLYVAKNAYAEYRTLLREARDGVALDKDTFWKGDAIIYEGMKKGQRLYHIMATQDVGFSKSSAYRNLHKGYLSAKKIDFPRVVKFKARKQYKTDCVPKAIKTGRTYDDFQSYIQEHDIKSWVEMDTVIGRTGGKVIMTFDFTFCNFMFGLLLDDKSAVEAERKIRMLKKTLSGGGARFGDVVALLLTDNGGEFANISAFMDDLEGNRETELFFCDPYRSCQKPKVEKNHTIFRDIVPKGVSFDRFTQETVNLIFSHVNSVKRKILNGKTPYELFAFLFGVNVAALLGVCEIPASEVIQSPLLLNTIAKTLPAGSRHLKLVIATDGKE